MLAQPKSTVRSTFAWIAGFLCLGLSLPGNLSADPTSSPDQRGPKLEFVQAITTQAEGCVHLKNIDSAAMVGDFLYVSVGKENAKRGSKDIRAILCFKRNAATGKLAFVSETTELTRLILAAAGKRLYAFRVGAGLLNWFDVDPATGALTEKDPIACPFPCGGVCVSPDQKDLYYKGITGPGVVGVHLGQDGRPVKVAELNSKGLERSGAWGQSPCAIAISPDGRFLYGVSGTPMSVAIMERKPTGEVISKKELPPPAGVGFAKGYDWVSVAVSPDGKWLYTSVWSYGKPKENFYLIYTRDPETGDVTFKEALNHSELGEDVQGWKVLFLPDGSGGYWSHSYGLAAFSRDSATGRITQSKALPRVPSLLPRTMVWDIANGFLYGGSEKGDELLVLAAEKVPAGK